MTISHDIMNIIFDIFMLITTMNVENYYYYKNMAPRLNKKNFIFETGSISNMI